MKRTIPFLASVFCLFFGLHSGSAQEPEAKPKRFADEAFVVETTEEDVDKGLNRIAGEIDTGFGNSDSGNYYKSEHQGRSGPFQNGEEHGY